MCMIWMSDGVKTCLLGLGLFNGEGRIMNGTICEQMREKNWSCFILFSRRGWETWYLGASFYRLVVLLESGKGGGRKGGGTEEIHLLHFSPQLSRIDLRLTDRPALFHLCGGRVAFQVRHWTCWVIFYLSLFVCRFSMCFVVFRLWLTASVIDFVVYLKLV